MLFDFRIEAIEIAQVLRVALNAGRVLADRVDRRRKFPFPPSSDEDVGASFTNSFAVARPIPLLPPVTNAILP